MTLTKKLQAMHEKLKKAGVEYFTRKSKTIDGCFVLASYEKYSCALEVYDNGGKMTRVEVEEFSNILKNSEEINALFTKK